MAIGLIGLLLLLAIASLAEARSRAHRSFILLALSVLAALAGALLWLGVRTDRLLGSPPVLEAAAALCTLYLAVDVVGLPVPIGRRLHLGLHSAAWQFDHRLFAQNEAARRSIEDAAGHPRLTADRLTKIAQRIGALPAPERDWAAVRDGWVQAWSRYAELLRSPDTVTESTWTEALSLQGELVMQTDLLRERYRAEARAISGKSP